VVGGDGDATWLAGWGDAGFETSLRLLPQPDARTASHSKQKKRLSTRPRSGILSIMGDGSNVIDRVSCKGVCNRDPWQGTTAFARPRPQSAAGALLHKFRDLLLEREVDRQTAAAAAAACYLLLLLRLLLHELLIRVSSVDRRLDLIPAAAYTTTPASDLPLCWLSLVGW
jgi:hypothetical protein